MALLAPLKYAEVQARLKYDLADQLLQWHRARVSTPAMARMLRAQTGLDMADETVRRWVLHVTETAA
jgi:hypothetical protein